MKCPSLPDELGSPPGKAMPKAFRRIGETMQCNQADCNRRAHSRDWCTTHYRRWRTGQAMDAPIRGYVQYEEDVDGNCKPMTAKTVRCERGKPFAAEYELLAELGLGRS